MNRNESPIACQMNALSVTERLRRAELLAELRKVTRAVQELADGFAFEFVAGAETWKSAAEFVMLERRCCPFLSFSLGAESEDGPMWVRITGRDGVKDFVARVIRDAPGGAG